MLYQYPTYDKQTHGPSTQGSRYQYISRAVRRAAKDATGKGRDVGRRTGRANWNTSCYASSVGIRGSLPCQRTDSTGCQRLEYQGFTAYRREIKNIFKKICQSAKIALDNLPVGKYTSCSAAESNAFRIFASPFHWLLAAPQAGGRGVFLTTQD